MQRSNLFRPTPILGAMANASYQEKLRAGGGVTAAADGESEQTSGNGPGLPRPASRGGGGYSWSKAYGVKRVDYETPGQ